MLSKKITDLSTNLDPAITDLLVLGNPTTGALKKIALSQISGLFGSTGTVSSVGLQVPTGLSITGSPITTSGDLVIGFQSGYSIPTNTKQSQWDSAYNFITGFPSQTGNAGKVLGTNGSVLAWVDGGSGGGAVLSVFGRTGAVSAQAGDYTTDQVTQGTTNKYWSDSLFDTRFATKSTSNLAEGTNLYHTTARARASLSFSAGSGAYDSSTGVITIPTNNNQLTNGAGYITGISYSNVINALGYTPVPQTRTITINGLAQDLSQNVGWQITAPSVFVTSLEDVSINGLTAGQLLRYQGNGLWVNWTPNYLTSVAWGDITGRPTNISYWNNDSGYITSSALSSYLPLSGGTLSGNLTAPAFFESSDKRLKKELIDNPASVSIENVKPKLYIKDDREELGYYAQDFLNILPSAVVKGDDGFLSLSYTQVHTAKINKLEHEIEALKQIIKNLVK